MSGGVEKPERDAAVDPAAEKDSDVEAPMRNGASQVRIEGGMEGLGRVR